MPASIFCWKSPSCILTFTVTLLRQLQSVTHNLVRAGVTTRMQLSLDEFFQVAVQLTIDHHVTRRRHSTASDERVNEILRDQSWRIFA